MTGLLIAKVLLLAFLVVACGALVFTYVRRRLGGVQPWKNPQTSPYLDLYRGGATPDTAAAPDGSRAGRRR